MPRCILIGGASHVGKSTCAGIVSRRVGGEVRTTDTLARHPGRPWPVAEIPAHVAEHYRNLPPQALLASVLDHYRGTVWPLARAVVDGHLADPSAGVMILEGSALLPELLAGYRTADVGAVWITAEDALMRARIRAESGHDSAADEQRRLIDRFVARNRLMNAYIAETARELHCALVAADPEQDAEQIAALCLNSLKPPPG